MLFNSLPFLYVFLPITYFVFWSLKTKNARYAWLAVTGYCFYAFWNYEFCALMAFSTLVSYLAGIGLLRYETRKLRLAIAVTPICVDLALLAFFKYANFGLETANALAAYGGLKMRAPHFDIILPIGISFYTFHTITYIVDSYKRVIRPTRNVFEFACYVSLFAQLVAGPIVRFREIEKDLETINSANRWTGLNTGASFFVIGLAKKVLIADTIALIIDPLFAQAGTPDTLTAWLCAIGYTYQLYFDFSGYSDMAVGLGHMFGLKLPQNFNSPYKATDVADFWRRWHISLSSFLRDYVYIPLGGNRMGGPRASANLVVTMLLGGLWHGANWTFVAWGAYHGVLLVLNRAFSRTLGSVNIQARSVVTFLLVVFGWVIFRSASLGAASAFLTAMVVPGHFVASPFPGRTLLLFVVALAALVAHGFPNAFEMRHDWRVSV